MALLAAAPAFQSSVIPLPQPIQKQLKARDYWHKGCPVQRSDLSLLTVRYRDFRQRPQTGQLIVNREAAPQLATVFGRLYALRFPINHMRLADFYGPKDLWPSDGDPTASFQCRQAVPSPCTGGKGTGSWSMHAYGLAVDINPLENPYVGCGESRNPDTRKFRNRLRLRKGMIGPRAIGAFASIGWGWGGAWAGNTKDYMHFSATGH